MNGPETSSVSIWARFAQPSGWCGRKRRREEARDGSVSREAPTLLATDGLMRGGAPARPVAPRVRADLFVGAARRAQGRTASIVALDPKRYERFAAPAAGRDERTYGKSSWAWRRDRRKRAIRRCGLPKRA